MGVAAVSAAVVWLEVDRRRSFRAFSGCSLAAGTANDRKEAKTDRKRTAAIGAGSNVAPGR